MHSFSTAWRVACLVTFTLLAITPAKAQTARSPERTLFVGANAGLTSVGESSGVHVGAGVGAWTIRASYMFSDFRHDPRRTLMESALTGAYTFRFGPGRVTPSAGIALVTVEHSKASWLYEVRERADSRVGVCAAVELAARVVGPLSVGIRPSASANALRPFVALHTSVSLTF